MLSRSERTARRERLDAKRLAKIAKACPIVDMPLPETTEARIAFFAAFLDAYRYEFEIRSNTIKYTPKNFSTKYDPIHPPRVVHLGEKTWLREMAEHVTEIREKGPNGVPDHELHFRDRLILPIGRAILQGMYGDDWAPALKDWIAAQYAQYRADYDDIFQIPLHDDGVAIDPNRPHVTITLHNALIIVDYDAGSAYYREGRITLPPMPQTTVNALEGTRISSILEGLPETDVIIKKVLMRKNAKKAVLLLDEDWEDVPSI